MIHFTSAWLELGAWPIVRAIGWTILHSLWEGALFAGLLAAALAALKNAPANARYAISCLAIALMVIAAGLTFAVTLHRMQPPPAARPVAAGAHVSAPITPLASPAMQPSSRIVEIPPASSNLLACLAGAWFGGVLILSLWHLGGWLMLIPLRRGEAVPEFEPALLRLAKHMGIHSKVRLRRTRRIDVPAVIGALRPVILLPAALLNELSPAQIEAILAHELAHIRRHDYLINLIQSAIETLLFYHPATWWISSQVRRERENCCDDIAAETCGDRQLYSHALASLEQHRALIAHLAAGAGGVRLQERIRRMLGVPDSKPRRMTSIRSLAAGLLAIACAAIPAVVAAKENSPPITTTSVASQAPSTEALSPIAPSDLKPVVSDYRITPGDLVQVSISDLEAPGKETTKQLRVSGSGMISMPLVGTIKLGGLTPPEAEKTIQKVYHDKQLLNAAQVWVSVPQALGKMFNVVGAVDRPSRYPIDRPDFRLLDALALAGGRPELMSQLRVIRKESGGRARVLDIPLNRLIAGDPGVNVVIRPGDSIVAVPNTSLEKLTSPLPGNPANWSIEQIAAVDPNIRKEVQTISMMESELAEVKNRLGSQNPNVLGHQREIEQLKKKLNSDADAFRQKYAQPSPQP